MRIIDAEGNEIDRVGYGKDADTPEGSPAPEPPEGKSIERKHLVYGYAPCKDTNNNSEDFEIKDTPTPKNSSFAMDPLPPPPVPNPGPPVAVPEFNATGLLALIGIMSIVLAIAIWGRNTDYTD